jgi:Transposase DDE domain group 1/Flavin containing amine oxidoreductase
VGYVTGEAKEPPLRPTFDRRIKLEFHGAKITSDGGLLAYRELDDAPGLTDMAITTLLDGRRGKNTRHKLSGLLRKLVKFGARIVRHGRYVVFIRRLLNDVIRTEFGVEPRQSSALQLIFTLPTVEGNRVDVAVATDVKFVVKGGSSQFIEALAEALSGQIERQCLLRRIEPFGPGFLLTFEPEHVVHADYVIIAIPFTTLRDGGLTGDDDHVDVNPLSGKSHRPSLLEEGVEGSVARRRITPRSPPWVSSRDAGTGVRRPGRAAKRVPLAAQAAAAHHRRPGTPPAECSGRVLPRRRPWRRKPEQPAACPAEAQETLLQDRDT